MFVPQLRHWVAVSDIYGVARGTCYADLMPTPTSVQRGPFEKRQRQRWVSTTSPAVPIDRGQTFFPSFAAALHNKPPAHDSGLTSVGKDGNWNGEDASRMPGKEVQNVEQGGDTIAHAPLTSEGLRQWEMHAHVDHVFDLVPFWQRGIDAAEKGEVLRLEEFLEKMEGDGGWRTANEVLGMLGEWKTSSDRGRDCDGMGWGQPGDWARGDRDAWEPDNWAASQRGGWGVASNCVASDATVSSGGRDSGWGIGKGRRGGLKTRMGRGKARAGQGGWGGAQVKKGAVDGDEEDFVDLIARQEAVTEERRRAMHMFFEMTLEEKMAKIDETIRFMQKKEKNAVG